MAGVIGPRHFPLMKDGAILANSGHFDVEVDVAGLRALATEATPVREHVTEFRLPSGRALCLLAEGRLVGQVAAEASPAAIMDLSFADQALSTRYLFQTTTLTPRLYDVPPAIDARVAALKLEALGLRLDSLTDIQRAYVGSWQLGTALPPITRWEIHKAAYGERAPLPGDDGSCPCAAAQAPARKGSPSSGARTIQLVTLLVWVVPPMPLLL